MAKQVQLRRGNTAQIAAFVGAEGEVVYNTEQKTLVVQDGVTNGIYLAVKDNPTFTGNAYFNANTGFGVSSPLAVVDIEGNVAQVPVTVYGSSIDCSQGNYFIKSASGPVTWTFTNVPSGRTVVAVLEITNGGNYLMTWPGSVKWPSGVAPTLTVSGVDILTFLTDDGGTIWRGVASILDSR